MSSSLIVPVIDVQNDNFKELWPAIVLAIKTSSFVSLDTELSGLGNRRSLLAECIEDRYKAICHAARTRSILSLGIACYKKMDKKAADTYLVQVYNLTLLCSEEYIIEPQSVKFLVQHGFDFNKQYAQGVPYCKGNNKGGADYHGVSIRSLFTELLRARKPLVLHNGLIDMAFLYQCFYAHLPERLAAFTADLSEMFPAGIYDTKYATEFELRLTASYLEYAYKKCKLDNSRSVESGGPGAHIHLEFCLYAGQMSRYVDYRVCPAAVAPQGQPDVCQRFSAFGWCPNGSQCPSSHDTDLIILQDEKVQEDKKTKKKRKRNKRKGGDGRRDDGEPQNKVSHTEPVSEEPAPSEPLREPVASTEPGPGGAPSPGAGQPTAAEPAGNGVPEDGVISKPVEATDAASDAGAGQAGENAGDASTKAEDLKKKLEGGTHRAGFDAFMTGFIFAHACALCPKTEGAGGGEDDRWLPDCLNKVYLSGKSTPLNIVKSSFSKSSKAHTQKMEMVWGKSVAGALAERAQQGKQGE